MFQKGDKVRSVEYGKDEIYTVEKYFPRKNEIKLKESDFCYNASNFEKVEDKKFKNGEKVVYLGIYDAEIFGIPNETSWSENEYAISYINELGNIINVVVKEEYLSKKKNKDELKKGDKFRISGSDSIVKIIASEYDEYYNKKKYYGKFLNGNYKGDTMILLSKFVGEIIEDE